MNEIDKLTEALSPTCKECGDELLNDTELKYGTCGMCMISEVMGTGD